MGNVSKGARSYIMNETPEICGLCGEGPHENDPWTVDHIIPAAVGGTNARTNLQRAHALCNLEHGTVLHLLLCKKEREENGWGPIKFNKEEILAVLYPERCKGFHGPNHGDRIDDLYHDCDVHHEHLGKDNDCPYYFGEVA